MIKTKALLIFLLAFNWLGAQQLKPIYVESAPSKIKTSQSGQLAAVGSLVWSEDFEAAGNDFPYNSISSTSNDTAAFKRGDTSFSNVGTIFVVPGGSRFAFTNDDDCNCNKSEDALILPNININGTNGAVIRFDAYFNRSFSKESAHVYVEAGANNWVEVGKIATGSNWRTHEMLIAGSGISNPKIKFVYSDSSGWASGLAIDNIEVYEAVQSFDLRLDSVLVHRDMPHEFYKEIPKAHASALLLDVDVKATNISNASTTGANFHTAIEGQMSKAVSAGVGNIAALSRAQAKTLQRVGLANGKGNYRFSSFPSSDSIDVDSSNDTIKFSVEVGDTVYSRIAESKATRGFWYGPNQNYTLLSQFELTAPDTATSISVYLHEQTREGDTIDVLIFSEFLQDRVKDTFPQINEGIQLTASHIGQWATFKIPRSFLRPGKYFVGIRTRGQRVLMGVSEHAIRPGIAVASYGLPYGPVDHLPFVKLNLKGHDCNPIQLNVSTMKPGCSQTNGQIVVNPVGGNPPYRYQWGSNGNYSTQKAINGIRSGLYQLTVTDTLGCSVVQSIALGDSNNVILQLDSIRGEACFGDSLGYLKLSASGGVPPYQFAWWDAVVDSVRTKLVAGEYHVALTDGSASGCVTLASFKVEGPRESLASSFIITDNRCFSDTLGSIQVQNRGGVAPYTYTWNDPNLNGSLVQNLATGEYRVTVADQNNCTTSDTLKVLGADSLGLSGMAYDTSGIGSIITNVVGGTSPYTYTWTGPVGAGFVNPGTPNLEGLIDRGNYRLLLTDSLGCEVRDTFLIDGKVSVEGYNSQRQVKLFPNPSSGEIYISGPNSKRVSIRVLSQSGVLILEEENYQGEAIYLNPGMYLIRVYDEETEQETLHKAIITD